MGQQGLVGAFREGSGSGGSWWAPSPVKLEPGKGQQEPVADGGEARWVRGGGSLLSPVP